MLVPSSTHSHRARTWEVSNAQEIQWVHVDFFGRPHQRVIKNLDAMLAHVLQLRVDQLEQRARGDVALHLLAFLRGIVDYVLYLH